LWFWISGFYQKKRIVKKARGNEKEKSERENESKKLQKEHD